MRKDESRHWEAAEIAGLAIIMSFGEPLFAGMPSPLPKDPETYFRLSDWSLARLQIISFFLLGFFVCAGLLQLLWNALQRDFPSLPRLTYRKSLIAIFLWGLLFIVVLTMISGARELMTPGAWQKQGFTYKLADAAEPPAVSPQLRRRHNLENLRTSLWHFAATHKGVFPNIDEASAIASELWQVPDGGGVKYVYLSGRVPGPDAEILVYEPEGSSRQRLVLRTNGDILEMSSDDIAKSLKPSARGAGK